MAEQIAVVFQQTPEQVLVSPMVLIGTPEDCITELRRREKERGVTQFFFSIVGFDENLMRRLKEEVIAHL
jgi:hypothetical protein